MKASKLQDNDSLRKRTERASTSRIVTQISKHFSGIRDSDDD